MPRMRDTALLQMLHDNSARGQRRASFPGDFLTALTTLYNESAENLSACLREAVDAIDQASGCVKDSAGERPKRAGVYFAAHANGAAHRSDGCRTSPAMWAGW
ncbi:hypothetical protein AAW14_20475 [Streptomyces hygroscopicus]|nr:hypothetical protein [Streptomyces hygroscopicus]